MPVRGRVSRRRGARGTHQVASAHQRRRHPARPRAAPARPPERPLRRRPRGRGLDGRSIRRRSPGRPDLGTRILRHEGRHRRGGVRGGSDPPRRRRAERQRRDQRDGGRRERRLRRRRVARAPRPAERGPHRFRDHPGTALRRSDLHRPPRRLLVRGADERADRPWQHAVPRRERDRAHGDAARSHPVRAAAEARGADDGGAGDPGGRAARDAEHQRHQRRPAGWRHPDAVRRGPLPGRVRSPVPARGGLRRDQGRDRRAPGRGRARRAGLQATRSAT